MSRVAEKTRQPVAGIIWGSLLIVLGVVIWAFYQWRAGVALSGYGYVWPAEAYDSAHAELARPGVYFMYFCWLVAALCFLTNYSLRWIQTFFTTDRKPVARQ